MSAIFYVLKLIASTKGIKPELIDRYAGAIEAIRPQKWIEPTQEEIDARDDEEIRRTFAPFIKQRVAIQKLREQKK